MAQGNTMDNVELLHRLVKTMGAMDLFGHVYEELRTEKAEAYRRAQVQGREEAFLRSMISSSKRKLQDTRVFPRVFHDPTGEALAAPSADRYSWGDPTALLMLPRIQRVARQRASEAMLEYIDWLQRSHMGEPDEFIARETGRSPATIRGGRKRAIEFLIEVAHDLRHGNTTREGDLPAALSSVADAFLDHRLDEAESGLLACARSLQDDPRWFNLAGLVAIAREEYGRAVQYFRDGLALADGLPMRAKLLNNWGKALHNAGDLEGAQEIYLRASRLSPDGAPPWLNLLAIASERGDIQDARYYANRLVKLLRSGKLSAKQRGIAMNRLSTNPLYGWVRRTDAWKGLGRWIRKASVVAALFLAAWGGFGMLEQAAQGQRPALSWVSNAEAAPVRAIVPSHQSKGDKGEGWIMPKRGLLNWLVEFFYKVVFGKPAP